MSVNGKNPLRILVINPGSTSTKLALFEDDKPIHAETINHLHQELEFAVPFEDTFDYCRDFIRLYEEKYSLGLPYTIFEVRFTPAGHDRTLIGAGRGRRSTWIDLVCNDSDGFEKYYAAAEASIKQNGARPHLGKFCKTVTGILEVSIGHALIAEAIQMGLKTTVKEYLKILSQN